MKPHVSVNLLTWNAERYIHACLDSILKQTYSNYSVTILDNASQDGTASVIKKEYGGSNINFLEKDKNTGFAAGHNYLLRVTKGEYAVLLNQDAILTPDFVEQAVEFMEAHPRVGSLQPKLLRYNFQTGKHQERLDSTGLEMLRSRRVVNRGQGEQDKGQYKQGEIFGVDGAAPVYRRIALEEIKLPIFKRGTQLEDIRRKLPGSTHGVGVDDFRAAQTTEEKKVGQYEYFDEDFFAYKEDVDLAWRLRLYGWRAWYVPEVVAYHERGAGESAARSWWAIIKERQKISILSKKLSWKNQRLMQIKNESFRLLLRDWWPFFKKELLAWGYVFIFEPRLLTVIPEFLSQLPSAWRKRAMIMANRRVSDGIMARWFVD